MAKTLRKKQKKKVGRKQLKKVTAQSEMILNDNSPNLALVPEKQKWYNNREPIGLAQH